MALLGGPAQSSILLSDLVRVYQDVVKLDIREKSKPQLETWLEVRNRSVKNLIEVSGNKDLLSLTRDDGRQFRAWWSERITENDLSTEGARQQVNALRKMIRVVCEHHDFTDPEPFAKISFEGSNGKREPFAIEFVRDVILAPNASDGLDPAAYDVMLICIDTGARASEIISMPKRDIHLRANIPYVDICDGNGREVKTRNAVRKIPLIGVALEAMRRNPNGFPQFDNKVKEVCNAINDHLRALQPDVSTDNGDIYKTLHCLRHTFKDRLRKSTAREEMIDAIMGHANYKPDYGHTGLDAKLEVLNQLVFSAQ